MVTSHDEFLMRCALDEAWKYQGLTFPNPAVGAVVSNDHGEILGIGAHQKAGEAHAEVLALKAAYKKLTQDKRIDALQSATELHAFLSQNHHNCFHSLCLHVTLEPCNHFGKTPPCSQLMHTLGLKRVVIGSLDTSSAKGGGAFLKERGCDVLFGCLRQACDELLSPFTCKEEGKPFVFFKMALSANGVASGGIITSEASRQKVHCLRDRCDLLVIGGNTVRTDRPILDARLCHGRAPDILIYSRTNTWDTTIPLFHIPNRKVFIEKSLKKVREYKMVMIEGGQMMLDSLKEELKWYLIFQSPHQKEGESIVLPEGLRKVFSQSVAEDTLTWYVRDDG